MEIIKQKTGDFRFSSVKQMFIRHVHIIDIEPHTVAYGAHMSSIAELVTAFGRVKLVEMKHIAKKQFQLDILYGDTDSIIVCGTNNRKQDHYLKADSFISTCKRKLGIDVDHQNTFVRSMILGKKHYIGIQADGKVIVKGMEGKKRDRPIFFNHVFNQPIDDYILLQNDY